MGSRSASSDLIERQPEAFRATYPGAAGALRKMRRLDDLLGDMPRMEFMLRFTISHPDMHTTIVGTANPQHLAANVSAAAKGPLPADLYEAAKSRLASPPGA